MKLLNSKTINGVLDQLNIGLESRPVVVSAAVARQIAYELPIPTSPVNSVAAAFNEQRPVIEKKLAEVNEQYLLPSIDEAVATTRRFWVARYQVAHEPTADTVRALVEADQSLPVSGETLVQVSSVFNGGEPVAAVESLLYAPCELVSAGLDRASLESLLDASDRGEFNRQYSYIESLQLQVSADVVASMESLEQGFASMESEDGEEPAKVSTPAERKSLIRRLRDSLVRFFKWLGEKISQFVDWILGRSKKNEVAIEVAAKVDSSAVDKLVDQAIANLKKHETSTAESLERLEKATAKMRKLREEDEARKAKEKEILERDNGEKVGIILMVADNASIAKAALTVLSEAEKGDRYVRDWFRTTLSITDQTELEARFKEFADNGIAYTPWTKLPIDGVTPTTPMSQVPKLVASSLRDAGSKYNTGGKILDRIGKALISSNWISFLDVAGTMRTKFDAGIKQYEDISHEAESKLAAGEFSDASEMELEAFRRMMKDLLAFGRNMAALLQVLLTAYNQISAIPNVTLARLSAIAASEKENAKLVNDVLKSYRVSEDAINDIVDKRKNDTDNT